MSADETTAATPLDLDAIEEASREALENYERRGPSDYLEDGPPWACDEQSHHVAMSPAAMLALVAEVRTLRARVAALTTELDDTAAELLEAGERDDL